MSLTFFGYFLVLDYLLVCLATFTFGVHGFGVFGLRLKIFIFGG